jgi:ribosomal protein S24E
MGEIMKLEIKSRKQNPLMKREAVQVFLEHAGKATPSRKDILKELAKSLKSKEDQIVIEKIITRSGKASSEIRIHVYKKASDVPKHKKEMMQRRLERPAKKEKPPEPKPEEKPPEGEEKPEEKPPEGEKPADSEAEPEPEKEEPKEEPEEQPEEKKEEPTEKPEEKPPEGEEKPAEEPEEKKEGAE